LVVFGRHASIEGKPLHGHGLARLLLRVVIRLVKDQFQESAEGLSRELVVLGGDEVDDQVRPCLLFRRAEFRLEVVPRRHRSLASGRAIATEIRSGASDRDRCGRTATVALSLVAAVAMPMCSTPRSRRIVRRLAPARRLPLSSHPSRGGAEGASPRAVLDFRRIDPGRRPAVLDRDEPLLPVQEACASRGSSPRRAVTQSSDASEISAIRR